MHDAPARTRTEAHALAHTQVLTHPRAGVRSSAHTPTQVGPPTQAQAQAHTRTHAHAHAHEHTH
eukprot:3694147-Pleurochrysis_carterae.AAC.4